MTLWLAALLIVTGCVEGVFGDPYGNPVSYDPNDLSVHQQFQTD
jgi:hypothetical protein